MNRRRPARSSTPKALRSTAQGCVRSTLPWVTASPESPRSRIQGRDTIKVCRDRNGRHVASSQSMRATSKCCRHRIWKPTELRPTLFRSRHGAVAPRPRPRLRERHSYSGSRSLVGSAARNEFEPTLSRELFYVEGVAKPSLGLPLNHRPHLANGLTWLNALDRPARDVFRALDVVVALEIQPALRVSTEKTCQPQRRRPLCRAGNWGSPRGAPVKGDGQVTARRST